jgi:hypothetical protein
MGIVGALVDALIERGTLTGDEVDTIIVREVSAESLAIEKQRRLDWQRTTESAASFVDLSRKQL